MIESIWPPLMGGQIFSKVLILIKISERYFIENSITLNIFQQMRNATSHCVTYNLTYGTIKTDNILGGVNIMSSLAKNLLRIRKENLLTQDDLAQKIDVTRQAVSNWERGCSEPDIQTLIMLAEALQVETNELIFGRKAEYRPTLRREYLPICIISGCVVVCILILQLTLYPYLLNLKNTQYLTHVFLYQKIVPPLGYFTGGVLAYAMVSLFYEIKMKRKDLLLLAILFALPTLVVMAEEVLWRLTHMYPQSISNYLTIAAANNPALSIVLYMLLPFLSGILSFLGGGKHHQ